MSLLQKNIVPDKKVVFPHSVGEAKDLIKETFAGAGNQWLEPEQKVYFASLGIDKDCVEQLDPTETRKVFNDLVRSRMILCRV